jgi:membrane protein
MPERTDENTAAPPGPVPLHGVWNVARRTFQEFGQDNGSLMAASVAFYLLLSIIPLVLVGVSVIGHVLGRDAALQQHVLPFLEQFLPGTQGKAELKEWLNGLIGSRGQTGTAGLVGLLLTAAGGFATLETAVNVTWGTPSRNFLMNKLFAVGMVFLIGGLFVLSFVMSLVVGWADRVPVLHRVAESGGLMVAGYVLPIFISGLALSAVYKLFPNTRVPWKPALAAGFLTALFWEVFKQGYAWYTRAFGDQSATYGDALAGVVGLVIWILYSSTLILLGSELTWVLSGCPSAKSHHGDTESTEKGQRGRK